MYWQCNSQITSVCIGYIGTVRGVSEEGGEEVAENIVSVEGRNVWAGPEEVGEEVVVCILPHHAQAHG